MNQQDATRIIDHDPFLLHPEYRNFVLGKSKSLNRNGIFGIGCVTLFASVFVLFGAVFLVGMVWETYQWFMINQQGVSGSAQVTRLRVSSGDDSDSYLISFQFSHDGSPYTREQSVAQDVYNRAEVGANIQVVYVPSNPRLAKVAGTNNIPIAMLLFVVAWNSVVYLVIFVAVRQYRRRKFLERNGKMLPGEILKSTHSTDSDGDLSLKVEYTFSEPELKKCLTKTEQAQRNDLKGQHPPTRGTPIIVLYYNEQHFMLL